MKETISPRNGTKDVGAHESAETKPSICEEDVIMAEKAVSRTAGNPREERSPLGKSEYITSETTNL